MAAGVEHVGTVVVGAGVCGLQAASRLSRDGINDFVVLEQQQVRKMPAFSIAWPISWANFSLL
jgi:thioredoxin reductase